MWRYFLCYHFFMRWRVFFMIRICWWQLFTFRCLVIICFCTIFLRFYIFQTGIFWCSLEHFPPWLANLSQTSWAMFSYFLTGCVAYAYEVNKFYSDKICSFIVSLDLLFFNVSLSCQQFKFLWGIWKARKLSLSALGLRNFGDDEGRTYGRILILCSF